MRDAPRGLLDAGWIDRLGGVFNSVRLGGILRALTFLPLVQQNRGAPEAPNWSQCLIATVNQHLAGMGTT